MKLEILGSGGAVTTPKIFCRCESCDAARRGGACDSRLGPSVFIHGPDILIDTPEEISVELNRSAVTEIKACLYSHWHPDHTAGKRCFEANIDWLGIPPRNRKTRVILTEKIAETFNKTLSIMDHFRYMESLGIIGIETVGNGESFAVGDYTVTPFQLAFDYAFGYRISGGGQNILIVMDELKGWIPDAEIRAIRFDLVYLPFGLLDVNPVYKKRLIPADHPLLETEQTITETLAVVRLLNTERVVLSHIEEPDNITRDLAPQLEILYSEMTGRSILLAYDTMMVEI